MVVQHLFALGEAQTSPDQPRNAMSHGEIVSLHIDRVYACIIYSTKEDHSGLTDYPALFPFLDELPVVNRLGLEIIQYCRDILIVAVTNECCLLILGWLLAPFSYRFQ
jgi:hypothetical protein